MGASVRGDPHPVPISLQKRALSTQATARGESKRVALGTSRPNYLDPDQRCPCDPAPSVPWSAGSFLWRGPRTLCVLGLPLGAAAWGTALPHPCTAQSRLLPGPRGSGPTEIKTQREEFAGLHPP